MWHVTLDYKTFQKIIWKVGKWEEKRKEKKRKEKKRKEKKRKEKENDTVEQKGRRKQTEASVLEPSACVKWIVTEARRTLIPSGDFSGKFSITQNDRGQRVHIPSRVILILLLFSKSRPWQDF